MPKKGWDVVTIRSSVKSIVDRYLCQLNKNKKYTKEKSSLADLTSLAVLVFISNNGGSKLVNYDEIMRFKKMVGLEAIS